MADKIKKELAVISVQNDLIAQTDSVVNASDADRKWASKIQSSWLLKGFRLRLNTLKAVDSGRLWRVAYMVNLDQALNQNQRFIGKKLGRIILEDASEKNHEDILTFLLGAGFLDKYGYTDKFLRNIVKHENKKTLSASVKKHVLPIEADNGTILFEAARKGSISFCVFLIDLGLSPTKALAIARNENYPRRVTTLKKSIDAFKRKERHGKEDKAITIIEKPKEIETSVTDNIWNVVDDNTIVKHGFVPRTEIKLETMFNFKARNVMTICCVDKSTPATVVIQNFRDIESDTELFEAWNKLKDMDKKPVEFTGNDNFIVIKPSTPSNLKIEKT